MFNFVSEWSEDTSNECLTSYFSVVLTRPHISPFYTYNKHVFIPYWIINNNTWDFPTMTQVQLRVVKHKVLSANPTYRGHNNNNTTQNCSISWNLTRLNCNSKHNRWTYLDGNTSSKWLDGTKQLNGYKAKKKERKKGQQTGFLRGGISHGSGIFLLVIS